MMRAVVPASVTGVNGLELGEAAGPIPAEGEQLVHVRAASLGPWDVESAEGAFAAQGGSADFPQVQGWDFAGETDNRQRVLGVVPQAWMRAGSLAELIAVPSAIVAPLSDTLDVAAASAVAVCALTALLLGESAR